MRRGAPMNANVKRIEQSVFYDVLTEAEETQSTFLYPGNSFWIGLLQFFIVPQKSFWLNGTRLRVTLI